MPGVSQKTSRAMFPVGVILAVILGTFAIRAQPYIANEHPDEIRVVELQGVVEVLPVGADAWSSARTNQLLHPFDHLRTSADGRAAIRWSEQSVIPLGAGTEIEILPPHEAHAESGLHLLRGIISFFHREKPSRIHIITHGAVAGVEGTEFVLNVNEAQLATLSVIDGRVSFSNSFGALVLTNHQQALAQAGAPPIRTAGFIANNVLQWCFYYPAVLDLTEVNFSAEEEQSLNDSLNAYRSGDVLAALAKFSVARQSGSGAEQIYHAGLLLAVGQAENSEAVLDALASSGLSEHQQRLVSALRQLIAAVKRQPFESKFTPTLATEFLAASYYEQSLGLREISLNQALRLAKQAAALEPQSGFVQERVAELEFSFGRIREAMNALDKSLALAPRNAQALALKGFLLAAQNKVTEAIGWFNRALAADSALGNAWLGRGLCQIRHGNLISGREDLLIAAALEPQRAELRSYLGKAYAESGDGPRATKEFHLAEHLDPNDPTAWLYSALLKQEHSQINDAIRDLETSQDLNDNRGIYRSEFLLDQDRAVRSANLAAMYRDAGMFDVSVREAARAVNDDYANYSAHLFLANSYNQLRDPNKVNLRYETPAENEYLLANLLAPVGANTLSPMVSQQEYSRLFERNHFGVVSGTEYLSRGAWTQFGSQYGTWDNFSYAFDAFYHSDPGQRKNNDLEQRQLSLAMKYQITPQDSVYLKIGQNEFSGGDLAQYYDPRVANEGFRVKETQEPIVSLGFHHEWSPNSHTLFLFNRIDDDVSFLNPSQPALVAFRPDIDPFSTPGVTDLTWLQGISMNERFKSQIELYSGELQQIWEESKHTTIVGGRIQFGRFHTTEVESSPSSLAFLFAPPPSPIAEQDITSQFQRFIFYGYHGWKIFEPLELIGGLAYDRITYPENFRVAPISSKERTADDLLPKAGLIWTPTKDTTLRFGYTRSLAGASLDQSYQLEPSQVAGFVQSFRSLIPESVSGANAGAAFETYGLSVEQKFKTETYVGLSGEILNSKIRRHTGAFDVFPDELEYAIPSSLREHLDYQEKSAQVTINQLLGTDWAFSARYRCSWADLKDNFVDVPDDITLVDFEPRQHWKGLLHQLDLTVSYNHPSGFFAGGEALWRAQNNHGYSPKEPGDDFWQFNAEIGYRCFRRRLEISAALLNITDQNYKLNPLNVQEELPRDRTLALQLLFNF